MVRRVADEGAYSNRLLPSALARSGLDQRDRALATELALRDAPPRARARRGDRRARRETDRPDDAGRARRAPPRRVPVAPHADPGSCGGGGDRGGRRAARARVRERDPPTPGERAARAARGRATTGDQPPHRYGAVGGEGAPHAAGTDEVEARRARLRRARRALACESNTCRATVRPGERVARGRPDTDRRSAACTPRASSSTGGDPTSLPGLDEGWFAVQDQASAFVVETLWPQPGERVLDVCAAPGGKAAFVACRVGEAGPRRRRGPPPGRGPR